MPRARSYQQECMQARAWLLKEEKELTGRGDELGHKRRSLPWVPVENEYLFGSEERHATLDDRLGGGANTGGPLPPALLVYHLCSVGRPYVVPSSGGAAPSITDDGLALPRSPTSSQWDTTLCVPSRAPIHSWSRFPRANGLSTVGLERSGSAQKRVSASLNTEES